jgi:hypothetical protein
MGGIGRLVATGVLFLCAGCGAAETNRIETLHRMLADAKDDALGFRGEIQNSPLGLDEFDAKVHFISLGQPYQDEYGEARRLTIQSGDGKMGLAGDYRFWGIKVNLYNWRGDTGTFAAANPQRTPADVTAATLQYGETLVQPTGDDEDWYNFRNTAAWVRIDEVDLDTGRIRGLVYLEGYVRKLGEPRPDVETAPVFVFQGAFHLHPQASLERALLH